MDKAGLNAAWDTLPAEVKHTHNSFHYMFKKKETGGGLGLAMDLVYPELEKPCIQDQHGNAEKRPASPALQASSACPRRRVRCHCRGSDGGSSSYGGSSAVDSGEVEAGGSRDQGGASDPGGASYPGGAAPAFLQQRMPSRPPPPWPPPTLHPPPAASVWTQLRSLLATAVRPSNLGAKERVTRCCNTQTHHWPH